MSKLENGDLLGRALWIIPQRGRSSSTYGMMIFVCFDATSWIGFSMLRRTRLDQEGEVGFRSLIFRIARPESR